MCSYLQKCGSFGWDLAVGGKAGFEWGETCFAEFGNQVEREFLYFVSVNPVAGCLSLHVAFFASLYDLGRLSGLGSEGNIERQSV